MQLAALPPVVSPGTLLPAAAAGHGRATTPLGPTSATGASDAAPRNTGPPTCQPPTFLPACELLVHHDTRAASIGVYPCMPTVSNYVQ
jgi:hypothetical protein